MEISVVVSIFFAALVCFKVCLALTPATINQHEATIWILELSPTAKPDHFTVTPNRSAAIISRNLILTIEDSAVSKSSVVPAAVFFKTDLVTSTNLSDFHRLTKVIIPTLESDAKSPKLAIFLVTPALNPVGLKPIRIRGAKTQANETCNINVWKNGTNTLHTGRRETRTTECPVKSDATFCVKLSLGDIDLIPFEGGLVMCNEQLAGLYSPQIASTEKMERSYLDLAPFKERIEKIIADNAPVPPPPNSGVMTSVALGLIVSALVASKSVL